MFDFLFPSDGTMEIVAHKVVDKGDITQMGEAVSKGDKEEENHRTAKSRGKHRSASGVKSPVIPSIFAKR